MFNSLGVGGGGSLIAGIACLLAPIPFLFYKYGEGLRKRSRFAPTEEKPDEARAEDQGSDSADELALDEEQGVPNQRELEEEIREKRHSQSELSSEHSQDRYLDASGMEKAEPVRTRPTGAT
jgi:DHA1 family multidrug resistance protein-like MFS transporter